MSSNLKKITSFFKSVIQNRKLSLYVFFFIISLSFWFLTVLSKTHETSLIIPVDYINYPIDLIADEAPDDYIEIRVKSSGISIMSESSIVTASPFPIERVQLSNASSN